MKILAENNPTPVIALSILGIGIGIGTGIIIGNKLTLRKFKFPKTSKHPTITMCSICHRNEAEVTQLTAKGKGIPICQPCHQKTHGVNVYNNDKGISIICPECHKVLKTPNGLTLHLKTRHGQTGLTQDQKMLRKAHSLAEQSINEALTCKICHRAFKNLNGLKLHTQAKHPK